MFFSVCLAVHSVFVCLSVCLSARLVCLSVCLHGLSQYLHSVFTAVCPCGTVCQCVHSLIARCVTSLWPGLSARTDGLCTHGLCGAVYPLHSLSVWHGLSLWPGLSARLHSLCGTVYLCGLVYLPGCTVCVYGLYAQSVCTVCSVCLHGLH